MSLRVETIYEANQIPTTCVICGRSTGGSFSPPVRHILMDDEDQLGDVCERCAYGSTELWRVALTEYAIRLETKAAVLRSLAARVSQGEPAPEGIAEDLVRQHVNRPGPRRPPFPPFRFGD
jgi:hypothetical protein